MCLCVCSRGAVEMLGVISCFARADTCCTPAARWGNQLQVKYPGLSSTRWSCGLHVKRSFSWASCIYSWIDILASPQPSFPKPLPPPACSTCEPPLLSTSLSLSPPLPPVFSSCLINTFNHFPVDGVHFWVQQIYYYRSEELGSIVFDLITF